MYDYIILSIYLQSLYCTINRCFFVLFDVFGRKFILALVTDKKIYYNVKKQEAKKDVSNI